MHIKENRKPIELIASVNNNDLGFILILSLIIQTFVYIGDRLSDEDVDQLFQGVEDSQGNINYEGMILDIPHEINI